MNLNQNATCSKEENIFVDFPLVKESKNSQQL